MRKTNIAVALMFAGGMAAAGLFQVERVNAANPVAAATQAMSETTEMQHLRATRKELNAAKDMFDKDPVDKANHRKEILDGIDKAIKACDDEIDELKAEGK